MVKLPDRWLEYQPMGTRIEGTNIVAFKVPLGRRFSVPPDRRFDWRMVVDTYPTLRLVIDLTNTSKYYDPERELYPNGIQYVKIQCMGHVLPRESLVSRFYKTIDDFNYQQYSDADSDLIGVHCTHGLNRTGYFVCRYMIQRLGMTPDMAISRFELARGHQIERRNYIDKIHSCR